MSSTEQFYAIALWSGYFTIFCGVLMLLGLLFKWGIRFRLVGVTGFMAVLTGGLFSLSLGLHNRSSIPDAVRFSRVFDGAAAGIVIAVSPEITETQLEATLRQAAADLYSPGRLSQGAGKMTIRARTVLHPEPGVSTPLYLGQVQRSQTGSVDNPADLQIYRDNLAKLPKVSSPDA